MKRTDWDLLSVLTGTIALALALTRFLEAPLRPFMNAMILGSPLGVDLSVTGLTALLVLGLTVTGTAVFLRTHPSWLEVEPRRGPLFWIGPGLLSLALSLGLNRLDDSLAWAIALLACALIIPLALLIEYIDIGPAERRPAWQQWTRLALTHLTAVLLFTLIYDARTRSLLSGTAVFLVAALLAFRLFWPYAPHLTYAFQYAGVVGLALGQMTWVLNYGRLSGLQGGLLLFLLFYLLTGLLHQSLQGQFDDGGNGRRLALEYAGVIILALLLVLF